MTGFGFGFSAFQTMFFVTFGLVLCVFIFVIVRGIMQWNHNNHQPILTVDAAVVAKRTDVTHHRSSTTSMYHSSTWYYVTFEVESRDRMEFSVDGQEYGMLAEGDYGRLTFQGTRYLGFERN